MRCLAYSGGVTRWERQDIEEGNLDAGRKAGCPHHLKIKASIVTRGGKATRYGQSASSSPLVL
eukprot:scaffold137398_cov39-Tisochrysis_lutea.AAC.1